MRIAKYYHILFLSTIYCQNGVLQPQSYGIIYRDKLLKAIKRKQQKQ